MTDSFPMIVQVVLDTTNARELAEFYRQMFGLSYRPGDEPPAEGEVCAVLSGGNVDAARLVECIRLGETAAGRRLVFSTVVPDRPGALAGLVATVAEQGANVLDVVHQRTSAHLHIGEVEVAMEVETRGAPHAEQVLGHLRSCGYVVSE